MLAEILFRVRRSLPDLGRFIGSWRLSVGLMVIAAMYQAVLTIFAALSGPEVGHRISQLLPFWTVWVLLLINTGVCLWRRFPALKRELSPGLALEQAPAAASTTELEATDAESAHGLLRGLGFRSIVERDGGLWATRNRWAPLGTYLFHGAFFVLALAVMASMLGHREARVWVAVGEQFTGAPEQFLRLSEARVIGSAPPSASFLVNSIVPEFWQDRLLFTRLEAELVLPGQKPAVTRINRPLWVGWATFVRLSGFGYTPRYELADPNGVVVDSAFVKMSVFPPGQTDYFTPENFPHRIEVEILPDPVMEATGLVNRSFNLEDPAVLTRVSRGKMILGEAVLRQGEGLDFEGLGLSFPEIRFWGEFSIIRDPGVPLLFAGFAVAMVGLLLKIRGGRIESKWTPGADGGPGRVALWGPTACLPGATLAHEDRA
jgi:hypothetical protein